MMVELLEAKRAGAFDTYESLARYMDEDIAVAVFGETLTTSAGSKGSQALGKVHDGVRLELIRADADLLSDTLNGGLVRWIVELNLPGYPVPRLWWDVSEPEDLNARATRDKALFDAGWTFTPERMAEIYGEGIVAKPAAPPPGQSAGAGAPGQPQPQPAETVLGALFAEARRAVRKGRMPKAAPARDTSDDLAEQLDQLAGAAQDRTIEAIRAVVARAETMQDVADQLLALYPQIDTAALAELAARLEQR
jgi:phage gp29-like protein